MHIKLQIIYKFDLFCHVTSSFNTVADNYASAEVVRLHPSEEHVSKRSNML